MIRGSRVGLYRPFEAVQPELDAVFVLVDVEAGVVEPVPDLEPESPEVVVPEDFDSEDFESEDFESEDFDSEDVESEDFESDEDDDSVDDVLDDDLALPLRLSVL